MNNTKKRIDWMLTLVPFISITSLAFAMFLFPNRSNQLISALHSLFVDSFSIYYLLIGLGVFLISLLLAFSKYGTIVLGGKDEKPKYSFFSWGCMMFTCGLAADILFYSFSEWAIYATHPHVAEMGNIYEWAGVYPLFHWSFIPWSFYLVLAVIFGFVLHVKGKPRQRFSEACRPIIGKHADKLLGRIIDLFALFALLAGTATTFSIATPLMAAIFNDLTGLQASRTTVTIIILIITCIVYTFATCRGFKGIGFLSKLCIWLFLALLAIVLILGGKTRYILENGFQSMGKMIQNFFELSTYSDPLRENRFPQDWTVYYWAYWMVWCVAAPFFIGNISKGRTIRQTILGGYAFGVGSTILSFIILGNYALGTQATNASDFLRQFTLDGDLYAMILNIIHTLPCAPLVLILVFLCMIAFYATSFDSIAYTAACYSYKQLNEKETPHTAIVVLWCLLLITLPIALVFSENSMSNIQSVSIICAFPIGIIMILMIAGFFKDAKSYHS